MIFVEREKPHEREEIDAKLALLRKALESENDEKVRRALKQAVPTYHAPEEVNCDATSSSEMQEAERVS